MFQDCYILNSSLPRRKSKRPKPDIPASRQKAVIAKKIIRYFNFNFSSQLFEKIQLNIIIIDIFCAFQVFRARPHKKLKIASASSPFFLLKPLIGFSIFFPSTTTATTATKFRRQILYEAGELQ